MMVAAVMLLSCIQNPAALRSDNTFLQKFKTLDYIGPLLFVPAIVCIILALQWGNTYYPWHSPVIITLIACGGLTIPI